MRTKEIKMPLSVAWVLLGFPSILSYNTAAILVDIANNGECNNMPHHVNGKEINERFNARKKEVQESPVLHFISEEMLHQARAQLLEAANRSHYKTIGRAQIAGVWNNFCQMLSDELKNSPFAEDMQEKMKKNLFRLFFANDELIINQAFQGANENAKRILRKINEDYLPRLQRIFQSDPLKRDKFYHRLLTLSIPLCCSMRCCAFAVLSVVLARYPESYRYLGTIASNSTDSESIYARAAKLVTMLSELREQLDGLIVISTTRIALKFENNENLANPFYVYDHQEANDEPREVALNKLSETICSYTHRLSGSNSRSDRVHDLLVQLEEELAIPVLGREDEPLDDSGGEFKEGDHQQAGAFVSAMRTAPTG